MAKYVIGYVAALLVAFVLLMYSSAPLHGEGVARGLRIIGGQGEIAPSVPPEMRGDGNSAAPPAMITVGEHGRDLVEAFAWCLTGPDAGVCSEGDNVERNTYPHSEAFPLSLFFDRTWDVSVIAFDASGCVVYQTTLESTFSVKVADLGPIGRYRLDVLANSQTGDASWSIEVDNQADSSPITSC